MPAIKNLDAEITRLLQQRLPASLLLFGSELRWRKLCQPFTQELIATDDPALVGIGRVDMALVTDIGEQSTKRHATELLGRLRTVHTDLLYVVATNDDDAWPLAEWLALGLQRAGEFENAAGNGVTLYRYDLGNYNRPRSWNNAQYWANPENWGKYRW